MHFLDVLESVRSHLFFAEEDLKGLVHSGDLSGPAVREAMNRLYALREEVERLERVLQG